MQTNQRNKNDDRKFFIVQRIHEGKVYQWFQKDTAGVVFHYDYTSALSEAKRLTSETGYKFVVLESAAIVSIPTIHIQQF